MIVSEVVSVVYREKFSYLGKENLRVEDEGGGSVQYVSTD